MPQPLPVTTASLSAPKAALLAIHLASNSELPKLRSLILQHPTTLSGEKLLRILLSLPESTPSESYVDFIDHVLSSEPLRTEAPEAGKVTVDPKPVANLTDQDARRAVRRLLPKLDVDSSSATKEDLVASFLITRAFRIDSELGALDVVTELLSHYQQQLPKVQSFVTANVAVLSKLVYGYSREPTPSLVDFHGMGTEEALEVMVADPTTIVRDLKELVEPYLSVCEEKEWTHVWARLSALPFPNIAEIARAWTPPEKVRLEFAAWTISTCYRCSETNQRTWDMMEQIHRRISGLVDGSAEEGVIPEKLGDTADLKNPLVQPTKQGLHLLSLGITSCEILCRSLAETIRLRLEGSREVQTAVLRQLIRSSVDWDKRSDDEWKKVRYGANWLRTKGGVLGRVSREEQERIVLAGMLAGARFDLAKNIYVTSDDDGGLPQEEVEKCVLDAFSEFFDNASNGNRTRGNMKNAYQWYVSSLSSILCMKPTANPIKASKFFIPKLRARPLSSALTVSSLPSTPFLPTLSRLPPVSPYFQCRSAFIPTRFLSSPNSSSPTAAPTSSPTPSFPSPKTSPSPHLQLR